MTAVADPVALSHQVWDIRPPLLAEHRRRSMPLAGGRRIPTLPRPHFLDANGLMNCPDCQWRGVATYLRGAAQPTCPACGRDSAPEPRRNDPCPCASGAKYKKCCGR